MISASSSPSNPAASERRGQAAQTPPSTWQIVLVVGLLLYAFLVGLGLLTNVISPNRAYILLVAPCLVPLVWCASGFLRTRRMRDEIDEGLLLSVIGWGLIALALLAKHFAVSSAGADAYAFAAKSPFTPIFWVLGVLALAAGGWQSYVRWQNSQGNN